MNQKILGLGLVIVLIISVVALYMILVGPKKTVEQLEKTVTDLGKRVEKVETVSVDNPVIGAAVGYVIEFENGVRFYVSGDTGLFATMGTIGDFYKPDVAFLSVNAAYAMHEGEFAYAAKLVNPSKYVVPYHWLTSAAWPVEMTDREKLAEEYKKYNLRAELLWLNMGEEKEILGVKTHNLGLSPFVFTSPEGVRVLLDASFTYNLEIVEPYRDDLTALERIDVILITHGHFDHLALSDLRKLIELYNPVIIVHQEMPGWLSRWVTGEIVGVDKGARVDKEQVKILGVKPEVAEKMGDLTIYMVPAEHSSGVTPLERW